MRAWTVDADDIQVADDLSARELHQTPGHRGVPGSATRRQVHRRRHQGVRQDPAAEGEARRACRSAPCACRRTACSTSRSATRSSAPTWSRSTAHVEPWSNVWLIAIAVGDAQAARHGRRPARRRAACTRSSSDDSLRSVIDHFVNLLDLPRSELFKCVNDTNNRLVPRLRTIATPVAIFIDSVDEYFNKHIKHRSAQRQRHRAADRRASGTTRRWAWCRWPTSCAASATT